MALVVSVLKVEVHGFTNSKLNPATQNSALVDLKFWTTGFSPLRDQFFRPVPKSQEPGTVGQVALERNSCQAVTKKVQTATFRGLVTP